RRQDRALRRAARRPRRLRALLGCDAGAGGRAGVHREGLLRPQLPPTEYEPGERDVSGAALTVGAWGKAGFARTSAAQSPLLSILCPTCSALLARVVRRLRARRCTAQRCARRCCTPQRCAPASLASACN